MNNIRGIYVFGTSVSIGGGQGTRVRGWHIAPQAGGGSIHLSSPTGVGGTDFRLWVIASTVSDNFFADGSIRFPTGVSVSVPTSCTLTLFVDP